VLAQVTITTIVQAVRTTTVAPLTTPGPTTTTLGRTIVVVRDSGTDWSVLAAFLAAIAALLLAVVTWQQLAVTRAQLGQKGALKVYPARRTFDPRERFPDQEITFLRPPSDDGARVRVMALHIRNVGPFSHKVELASSIAKVGISPRKVKVEPAWGRWCGKPHDHPFLPAPSKEITTFVVYLIGDWKDEWEIRVQLDLVIGGEEIVHFDGRVILWRCVVEPFTPA
jgi:hypothetical protein